MGEDILKHAHIDELNNEPLCIKGTVAPGFESVKQLYEHNMRTLAEENTQLCIYHKGEKVVDLWASAIGDPDFSPDSLVNIFSSGKSFEAIAMASLVDKGLLDYDAKITHYWPEFAKQGKQNLTVAELMRHEAGLAAFNVSLEPADLLTENIKQNKVGRIIEDHPQTYRPAGESRRDYHAITRGWIVNEVFRRIDPAGRTIGEFLREEINLPLDVEVLVGVKQAELDRRSRVVPLGFGFQFRQSLKPKILNRKMELNIFQISRKLYNLLKIMQASPNKNPVPPFAGMGRIASFNEPEIAMGETPSAATNSSARALAKVAAMMSMGGKLHGHEYVSDSTWKAMHAEPVEAAMGFTTTTFTQGGVALFDTTENSTKVDKALNQGREGFYGWMGLGGSIFQWHPQHQIGFGYVPTSLNVLDIVNERGKAYQAEVLRCVERM
jgi:CubicO group peptidase (beta-lactamase class C family)